MSTAVVAPTEAEPLLTRVLDALLREDFLGMRTAGRLVGGWLRFRLGSGTAELPVRPGRFLCAYQVREPVLVVDGRGHRTLDEVFDALRTGVDPRDLAGFEDFRAECGQALEVEHLSAEHRPAVLGRPGTGLAASTYYDTLAAYREHPVYPTGRARLGLSRAELLRYAPEFRPSFPLRWLRLPADSLTLHGKLPAWWPDGGDRIAVPVHPLTADKVLAEPLDYAVPVVPTLSMRTVAVLADATTHVKLPLPTSTLGRLNRRGIKPGTLPDGARTERLLAKVIAREPRFAGRILLADEQTYGETGHEFLAFLVRRYPPGLDNATVVSAAALLAPDAAGRPVLDELADRYFGGEPFALLDRYLELLFDWQLTLLRYGLALESHPQNISLLLDEPAGHTRLRLLLRDNDGPRLHAGRLADALDAGEELAGFTDRRVVVDRLAPLVDMFTTITVHLCAGAVMFGLAEDRDTDTGLNLVRARLDDAVRHCPAEDARVVRAELLDAPTLPVKAMVTAGTLLTKKRSGASDINKCYLRSGPNYLMPLGDSA